MKTNRKHALIAGFAIVIMAVAAGFSYGYAHSSLIIPQNISETVKNLRSSITLFKLEIVGWTVILICDVLAAWALYKFFMKKNKNITLLMGGTRIIYATILAIAIIKLIQVSTSLNNIEVTTDEIFSYLNSFETIWSFGLIIFGFHLLFLGILALQAKNIHNAFGILLIFAGVCYSALHGAKQSLPDLTSQINSIEMVLSAPMALGEIGFAFWLLIRGGKSTDKKVTMSNETKIFNAVYEGQG